MYVVYPLHQLLTLGVVAYYTRVAEREPSVCEQPNTRCSMVVDDYFDIFKTQCFLPASCGSELHSYTTSSTFFKQIRFCYRHPRLTLADTVVIRAVQLKAEKFFEYKIRGFDAFGIFSVLYVFAGDRVEVRRANSLCSGYVPVDRLCHGQNAVTFTRFKNHEVILGSYPDLDTAVRNTPLFVGLELEPTGAVPCSLLRKLPVCQIPVPVHKHTVGTLYLNSTHHLAYNGVRRNVHVTRCNIPFTRVFEVAGSYSVFRSVLAAIEAIVVSVFDQLLSLFSDIFGTLEGIVEKALDVGFRVLLHLTEKLLHTSVGQSIVAALSSYYTCLLFQLDYVWCLTLATLTALVSSIYL